MDEEKTKKSMKDAKKKLLAKTKAESSSSSKEVPTKKDNKKKDKKNEADKKSSSSDSEVKTNSVTNGNVDADVDEEEEEEDTDAEIEEEYTIVNDDNNNKNKNKNNDANTENRNIETGDSIKVKQVLDESLLECLQDELGYDIDYKNDNIKMLLMFIASCFALTAQFYPLPFPKNRILIGICVGIYFFISGILQFIITFIDKNHIIKTAYMNKSYVHGNVHGNGKILPIRESILFSSVLEKYEYYYKLNLHAVNTSDEYDVNGNGNSKVTVGEFYIGKYFTETGDFDEKRYWIDIKSLIKLYCNGKYGVVKYDHKSD